MVELLERKILTSASILIVDLGAQDVDILLDQIWISQIRNRSRFHFLKSDLGLLIQDLNVHEPSIDVGF